MTGRSNASLGCKINEFPYSYKQLQITTGNQTLPCTSCQGTRLVYNYRTTRFITTSNSTYTAAVHLLHMNNQSIDFQCHTVTHCTWCNSRLGHIPRLPQHTVCSKSWGGAWEWGYARPHQLDWSNWEMETTIPRNNQWDTAQGLQEKRQSNDLRSLLLSSISKISSISSGGLLFNTLHNTKMQECV